MLLESLYEISSDKRSGSGEENLIFNEFIGRITRIHDRDSRMRDPGRRYEPRSESIPRSVSRYRAKSEGNICLLYTSPSPRDKRQSRMPSSA